MPNFNAPRSQLQSIRRKLLMKQSEFIDMMKDQTGVDLPLNVLSILEHHPTLVQPQPEVLMAMAEVLSEEPNDLLGVFKDEGETIPRL